MSARSRILAAKLDQLAPVGRLDQEVSCPPHYTQGSIEVIDFIEDQQLNFCRGNIVKYVVRAPHKGEELKDLKKAKFYLDRLIEQKERANAGQ